MHRFIWYRHKKQERGYMLVELNGTNLRYEHLFQEATEQTIDMDLSKWGNEDRD